MSANQAMAQFEVKPLPYGYDALGEAISAETLKLHHDKHYAGYVANLNRMVGGTPFGAMSIEEVIENSDGAVFNNAAQVWNHEFYFDQFSATPKRAPEGALAEAINAKFKSLDDLKATMLASATSLFGSGWVWLVVGDDGKLTIVNESNAGTPIVNGLKPLLTIDVWEHAYYVDFQNRRGDAVLKFWDVLDWAVIENRFK